MKNSQFPDLWWNKENDLILFLLQFDKEEKIKILKNIIIYRIFDLFNGYNLNLKKDLDMIIYFNNCNFDYNFFKIYFLKKLLEMKKCKNNINDNFIKYLIFLLDYTIYNQNYNYKSYFYDFNIYEKIKKKIRDKFILEEFFLSLLD